MASESLAQAARKASAQLLEVIDRVCGACENSCCHQGTMMGSSDARRLYKGLQTEPERAEIVRAGLRKRGEELAADLMAMRNVAGLLRLSLGEERRAALEALEARIDEWQQFVDALREDPDLSPTGLLGLLRFSALRSNCIRALRQFEGAQAALVSLSRGKSSFRLAGQRMGAPRCLFHVGGCLCGRWKPAKCANFFCAGQPNVLREIARRMAFDDFVLANFDVCSAAEALAAVQLELKLGREFVEPKVFIGLAEGDRERLLASLRGFFAETSVDQMGAFMLSTGEARSRLNALPVEGAVVAVCAAVSGAALYELAVALDGFRATGTSPAFYLLADQLTIPSPMAHPLWADSMMSQPLGSLDICIIE